MNLFKYGAVLLLSVAMAGCSVMAKESELQKPASIPEQKQIVDLTKMEVKEFFPNDEGAFILRDLEKNTTFIFNEERAKQSQAPQSTFKIMNALIGLQVKAVDDEYTVKRWDGVKRDLDAWNKDHTLGSAMRYSTVWYYQQLARDIGAEQMKEWLHKASYGNQDISGGIDKFWLNSSLKITPLEQADFLEKLYKEQLPFDKQVMKTVKRMIIQQDEDLYTLYGKTGTRATPPAGWFVGFVKVEGHPYVFVTTVNGEGDSSGVKAKNVTLQILKKYNMLPMPSQNK
ncbi:class D beta-lactamase [Brevibacillus laterosporus]|nr:class D beta-lactamase [Brevibacillus laterosporus]TPG70583.1 class D beta-lactamase [Brevibacillus laterosporus]